MATSSVRELVSTLKTASSLSTESINDLRTRVNKVQLDVINEYCARDTARLKAENEKLREAVELNRKKLVALQILHGVPQIPLPGAKYSLQVPSTGRPASASQSSAVPVQPAITDKVKPTEKAKHDASVPATEEQNAAAAAKKGQKGAPTEKLKKPAPEKAPATASEDDSKKPMDVSRLEFRIGKIVEISRHPDADSLYVEKVDLGDQPPLPKLRTVVSGLVKHVPIEQMQGKIALFMCNLKPAGLRGISSEGMIMCASTPERVEILDVPAGSEPGDRVHAQGYPSDQYDAQLNPKRKIWESVAPDLRVDEQGIACYKGAPLTLFNKGGKFTAPTLRNVNVK